MFQPQNRPSADHNFTKSWLFLVEFPNCSCQKPHFLVAFWRLWMAQNRPGRPSPRPPTCRPRAQQLWPPGDSDPERRRHGLRAGPGGWRVCGWEKHQKMIKNVPLVGGFSPPLWKIWVRQIGSSELLGKRKNVPNHQPVIHLSILHWKSPNEVKVLMGKYGNVIYK